MSMYDLRTASGTRKYAPTGVVEFIFVINCNNYLYDYFCEIHISTLGLVAIS